MAAAIAGGQGAFEPNKGGVLNSMLATIVDLSKLGDPAETAARIESTKAYIKSARPAPGVESVLVPGEPERLHAAHRSVHGIDVDDTSWRDIREAAARLGITEAEITQAIGSNAPSR